MPAIALRVLRSEFDHIRSEELSRANVEHGEAPEPFVQVKSIEALSQGRVVQTVEPGEPMTVRVTLEARKRLEDWILGMGFDSATGQVIYGTNSKLMGVRLRPVEGTAEFEFEIPRLPLGAGTYTIHGAVADRAGAELHRLREGARFVVAGDGSEVGFLTLGPHLARVDASDRGGPDRRMSLT